MNYFPLMILNFMLFFILILMALMSIAFFTLLERKIMGYCQIRKGPNKSGYLGILQPFSDALKLFSKEMNLMFYLNLFLYVISPIMSIVLMMIMWLIFYFKSSNMMLNLTLVFFLCVSSLSSYTILFSGWASNSKYSLIGSYRGFAQIISYEVSMAMLLISLSLIFESFSIKNYIIQQEYFMNFYCFFLIFIIWMIILLAETNRTPFDLSEGESELVSGFNIEYGSWLFAMIFMSEYGMIILMSMITNYLFLGFSKFNGMMTLFLMILFIMIRSTFVRFRYDKLMMMAWKNILPVVILFFFFSMHMFFVYSYSFCINFWKYKFKSLGILTMKMLSVNYTLFK